MSRTPLRAIPSTLTQKSTPSLPPSSLSYEPFVKAELGRRFTNKVLLYSAIFSWLQTVAWVLRASKDAGFTGKLFLLVAPKTIAGAVVMWLVGAVPVGVMRKVYLTAQRTIGSSPSRTLRAAFNKSSTWRGWLTYAASSVALLALHVWLPEEDDARLSVFVKSRKHPHYLNGRLVFLFLSQLTVATGLLLRNVLQDRLVFSWANRRNGLTLVDEISTAIIVAILSTVFLPISVLLFLVARALILPILLRTPLLSLLLKPFMAHFPRSNLIDVLRHTPLLLRAWFLSSSTLFTWEMTSVLFDIYIPQRVPISAAAAQLPTLISGVSSQDRTFQFLALREILELPKDAREALFGDQKHVPNMWSCVVREALLVLGKDYQVFLRRGAELPPPPPPAASVPAPAKAEMGISTPLKVEKKPIFRTDSPKTPVRKVLDAFAADGNLSLAVQEGAEVVGVPELFKSVSASISTSIPAIPNMMDSGELEKKVKVKVKILSGWMEWFTRPRLHREAEVALPMREVDVVVIQVLSRLICASLTEDVYGVVQRDIPKILEAFISFLDAVESYQASLPPPSDETNEERDKALDVTGVVVNALKECMGQIVHTFGDKLTAFKFPPRIAARLQGFVDYS